MLMVVAGLIARTVINLQQLELGFEPAGVLTMNIDLPESKYGTPEEVRRFFLDMTQRVRNLTGVEDVALVSSRPSAERSPVVSFEIEGRPPSSDELEQPTAQRTAATPGYLDLLAIPVHRGRGFVRGDTEDSISVCLVSREAERRYWPKEDPIGQRLRIDGGDSPSWARIVGVVDNLRAEDASEPPQPRLYFPFTQEVRSNMVVMVRSPRNFVNLAGLVRSEVWKIDPNQPIDNVRSMEQVLYDEESSTYALITLFVTFALFAFAMAASGIYGVMSYSVSHQAREIGVRLALGAEPGDLCRMILRRGAKLIALGAGAGLGGAFLTSRLLTSLVFGISTLDPVTFIGVPVSLVAVALLASYLPARRATRVDPMTVLRIQ